MTAIAMSPAELLFSDAEGKSTSLEDMIDDGLDGAYRDRIPALIGCCTTVRRAIGCTLAWCSLRGA